MAVMANCRRDRSTSSEENIQTAPSNPHCSSATPSAARVQEKGICCRNRQRFASGVRSARIRMPEATFSGVCSMRLSGPKKKYQSPKIKASLQQSTTPISKIRRGRDLLEEAFFFITENFLRPTAEISPGETAQTDNHTSVDHIGTIGKKETQTLAKHKKSGKMREGDCQIWQSVVDFIDCCHAGCR